MQKLTDEKRKYQKLAIECVRSIGGIIDTVTGFLIPKNWRYIGIFVAQKR